MSNVSVGIGGRVNTPEAAKILGCSPSYMYLLKHKGKLKPDGMYPRSDGRGKEWLWKAEDLYRFKQSHPIKSFSKDKKKPQSRVLSTGTKKIGDLDVTLHIDSERAQLLTAALKLKKMTIKKYLEEQLEWLEAQIGVAIENTLDSRHK